MGLKIARLPKGEVDVITEELKDAKWEVLIAYDEIDGSFKFKIDGGVWSPPFGDKVK